MPERRSQSLLSSLLVGVGILLALTTVAVILEYDGPYQGWVGRLRARLSPPPAPSQPPAATAADSVSSPPPPVPALSPAPVATLAPAPPDKPASQAQPPSLDTLPPEPGTDEEAAPVLEQSDLEKRYDEAYNRILASLPQPKEGDRFRLTLIRGDQVRGTIEKLEPGRVTMRLEHGTMTYPVHVISPPDVLKLFPTIAARYQALAELRGEDKPLPDPEAVQPVGPATAALPPPPETATAPVPVEPTGPFQYDPTPGPTPEELKPTLAAFGEWLKNQHRRVGGRIADTIYARRQAGRAILYLRMDPLFLDQDYSIRYQTAEGMQIFWGLRCESNGVARANRAHVVLLDQSNRIVGGSRLDDPAVIWLRDK